MHHRSQEEATGPRFGEAGEGAESPRGEVMQSKSGAVSATHPLSNDLRDRFERNRPWTRAEHLPAVGGALPPVLFHVFMTR